MKKLATFIGLALVMLTTSCSQDVTTDVTPTTKVTLGLSIDATRTYIGNQAGNQYEVLWSEGDKIAVNGVEVAVPAQFVGKSNLEFAVDAAEEYNIAYPAEAVKDNVLTISEVQKFVDGSFAVGSGVLVGYTTTEKATLKNLYGFIKFTVSGAANVNAVTVTAEGGEAISGTFAVDYKNATISPLAGKDIIRVTDVKAAEGKATVVVAVPAGEYAEGFSVKVKDNANGVMTKSLKGTTGATVEAGVVYSLPEVAYAATAKEVVIMTAEDLAAFATAANTPVEVAEGETAPCPYADWVSEDGEVKLGADIDMTDVDFTPIASFDGVFNGQGFAIKNWSATGGLIVKNAGVVKNIVIDESCSLEAYHESGKDINVAFVVEYNEPDGLVAGCVNNGNVTVSDLSKVAHRVAGVVGASYGKMKDCINNGTITVGSDTDLGNGQNIAGVVAYINPNAGTKAALGKALVENCVNNGNVKVYFNCKPKSVNVGGVVASTQNHGLATNDSTADNEKHRENHKVVLLGSVKNCANYGEVSYGFATKSTGTYTSVGGIIGYAECNIENCDNYGKVSFLLDTDNATAGSCPSCAGVVGKNIFNVKNCNNYGEVNVAGVWSAGTAGNALVGGMYQAVFGGVAGYVGVAPYNSKGIVVVVPDAVKEADPKVEYCNNYGKVTINNKCKAGGGTQGFLGGVIGGAAVPVENCANYGEVNISSHTGRVWMGGVLGYSISDVKKLYNYSDKVTLTIDELCADSVGSQAFGGVIGQAMNIDNCANNGAVTLVCNATKIFVNSKNEGDLYAGGVAGYANTSVTNCALNADVTVTMNTTATVAGVKLGGIVGQIKTITGTAQPIDNCTTAENVKVTLKTKTATGNNFVGGIIAQSNNGVKDCVNKAAVELEWLVANTGNKGCAVAGVAALQKQVASGCSNEGSVTIKMNNSTCFLYAAGVVANHSGSMSDCSNSGNIVITDYAAADSETSFYGGLAAKATGTVADDCTNTGVVTLNGETL